MKGNKFLGKLLTLVFVWVLLLNLTTEVTKSENMGTQTRQTNSTTGQSIKKAEPFDIPFGDLELWPFGSDTIGIETTDNGKVLNLKGDSKDSFGVTCWEKEVRLNGNRTLEIEVLELGSSSFSYNKMLKVFIWNVPEGKEIALKCKDPNKRSSDPEFVLKGTGIFQYSLEDIIKDDAVYKLGLTFYNAKLEGFRIRARFVE